MTDGFEDCGRGSQRPRRPGRPRGPRVVFSPVAHIPVFDRTDRTLRRSDTRSSDDTSVRREQLSMFPMRSATVSLWLNLALSRVTLVRQVRPIEECALPTRSGGTDQRFAISPEQQIDNTALQRRWLSPSRLYGNGCRMRCARSRSRSRTRLRRGRRSEDYVNEAGREHRFGNQRIAVI